MGANDLVSLRTAVDWFPHKGGRKPSVKALTTWIETGSGGVRLQAERSGGEWFTRREWVESFLMELAASKKPKAAVVEEKPAKAVKGAKAAKPTRAAVKRRAR